ncbi:metallophosphoesterase family protein [Pelomyxa schiedti]|nr:metallophosphoesterase family protein [Pelomyxa schiedti]
MCGASFSQKLQFDSNGYFKVVQLTDLHFGDPGEADRATQHVMRTVLEIETPDLVWISGDWVAGYDWGVVGGCAEYSTGDCWPAMTEPLIEANVPWAYVFGNHDHEGDLQRPELLAIDKSYNLSMTGGVDTSTYVLQVMSATNPNVPTFNMWFFDSGNSSDCIVPGYCAVSTSQLDWFRTQSAALVSKYGHLYSVAIQHIPFQEIMNLWNYHTVYGTNIDDLHCSAYNSGEYIVLLEQGDVKSVHFGHDHLCDFYGDYYGITFAYGRKTGYAAYNGLIHGARVLLFKEDLKTHIVSLDSTWIREVNGNKVVQQPHEPDPEDTQFVCCYAEGTGCEY